jgi:uncharacterized membrane protein YeaQ/YmgE (transglycosylase-associated protein family)
LIGFGIALFYTFVLKKDFLGHFPGALAIGIVGSFLGGVFYFLFKPILEYLASFNEVNVFTSVFVSAVILWIFSKISRKKGM